MRHHAVNPNILESPERIGKFFYFIVTHAQSPHPGINLQMNIGDPSGSVRRSVQRRDHVQAIDDRHERFFDAKLSLPIPEPSQTKYRLPYLRTPQLYSFLWS